MTKKKDNETVSKTELQILDLLWTDAPQTIRGLCQSIYGDTSTSYYATVQSLLDRLESKDWVVRDRSKFRHEFSPARTRSDFVGQQIQSVADTVCGGSISALLGQLSSSKKLTASERRALRKLIEGGGK